MRTTIFCESRRGSQARVRQLDEIGRELDIEENLLVKFDVQGYEGPVLRGVECRLQRAALVLIETSFIPLYREQLLFADLPGRMGALGFTCHGNLAQYDDPRSGCPLFADSFFINARCADRVLG